MPSMSSGSAEHKARFCRQFVDTSHAYQVRDLPWPALADAARHILFFIDWVALRRLHLPFHRKASFLVRRGLGISLQALGRARTALQLRGADDGSDFTMQVPESIGEVTLTMLAETCLRENER